MRLPTHIIAHLRALRNSGLWREAISYEQAWTSKKITFFKQPNKQVSIADALDAPRERELKKPVFNGIPNLSKKAD